MKSRIHFFSTITVILLLSVFAILLTFLIMNVIFGVQFTENGDIYNWVGLVVEIGFASGITLVVWYYTRNEQTKTTGLITDIGKVTEKLDAVIEQQKIQIELKEKSEFLHYKERLLYELSTLVSRVDTAMTQYIKNEQKPHMLENINLAKINLEGLRQINAIFLIPAEIKSQCDDLLSFYHAIMNGIERGTMMGRGIETRKDLVKSVQKLLESEFFYTNNSDSCDKKLKSILDSVNRILVKSK